MPDHGLGRVHHFRGHVAAGVNWRPMRFVDEVPSSRVCSLCRMIPKQMVVLPCSHAMCPSCHAASLEGGVGHCPLDQVQFEEAECVGYEFPTRIAKTLKVYCWNQQHGCEYTGTMDRMLEHYENECTFHTVECLRCGEEVQHRDLPAHYAAGCSAGVTSAITESSEPPAPILEDVNADMKNLKPMLRDLIHDQLLPVMQSQLNELTEQVRSQETRFAGITRDIGACERNLKGDMGQMAATISSTMSQQRTSLENPEGEGSTSSSLSLRTEAALILRKLERLSDLQVSWQTYPEPDFSRVMVHCRTMYGGGRDLYSALSTTPALIEKICNVAYNLTLENCQNITESMGFRQNIAQIMLWHMRDTYFTVAVLKEKMGISGVTLIVEIEFNGLLVDSKCWPPFWQVSVWDNAMRKHRLLTSCWKNCSCDRYDDSLQHFHLQFYIDIGSLNIDDFLRDGKIAFQIVLNDTEMDEGIEGRP